MPNISLLLVEDEIKTANALKKGLEEKDYNVKVAFDAEAALRLLEESTVDVVVTDVMMPRMTGIDFCRKVRENNRHVAIIMLSALGLTTDKLKGFQAGADDYIVKPFDFDELLARIKVAYNRTHFHKSEWLEYADLKLNVDSREVIRGSSVIGLTAKEYSLMEYLMRNNNRLIVKEEILKFVWGLEFDPKTNIVEVYINYLRNKVDKNFSVKLIHTKKGLGYILRSET
jgi:two-component system copper resistance phosphate regulon response regulator CusR